METAVTAMLDAATGPSRQDYLGRLGPPHLAPLWEVLKGLSAHAVPGWTWRSLTASEDCVLFFFSDRAAQEKFGLHRQQTRAGDGRSATASC
jgi:gentisate 1,2-dioxygenase